MKLCIVCQKSLVRQQTKFCSVLCKNRYHQTYIKQRLKGIENKKELIAQFGGKCEVCGYRKNLAVLSFHHVDPDTKEFKLDLRHLSNNNWTKILREARKCRLLCANCHLELHHPELDLVFKDPVT